MSPDPREEKRLGELRGMIEQGAAEITQSFLGGLLTPQTVPAIEARLREFRNALLAEGDLIHEVLDVSWTVEQDTEAPQINVITHPSGVRAMAFMDVAAIPPREAVTSKHENMVQALAGAWIHPQEEPEPEPELVGADLSWSVDPLWSDPLEPE